MTAEDLNLDLTVADLQTNGLIGLKPEAFFKTNTDFLSKAKTVKATIEQELKRLTEELENTNIVINAFEAAVKQLQPRPQAPSQHTRPWLPPSGSAPVVNNSLNLKPGDHDVNDIGRQGS